MNALRNSRDHGDYGDWMSLLDANWIPDANGDWIKIIQNSCYGQSHREGLITH